eukprot:SAG31_NODE_8980_length_1353_cov_1.574960_1_plen_22_part_10
MMRYPEGVRAHARQIVSFILLP